MKRLTHAALVALIACVLLHIPTPAQADTPECVKHPARKIGDRDVTLVVSVDWDWSTKSGLGSRTYLEEAFKVFSQTTFNATEGRVRVCGLWIYKEGRNARTADIHIAQTPGRAHAHPFGLCRADQQVSAFLRDKHGDIAAPRLGQILAHEFAHYALGLLDEYREDPDPPNAIQSDRNPRVCDVSLSTLMGKMSTDSLSLPADYSVKAYSEWSPKPDSGLSSHPTKAKLYEECEKLTPPTNSSADGDAKWRTAHWRHYQSSAWEVLILPPERRPPAARFWDVDFNQRHGFNALRGNGVVPETLAPPKWGGQCFLPVFVDGVFAVVVIDRSTSMNAKNNDLATETMFQRALKYAAAYIESLSPGVTVAVLAFEGPVTTVVPPTTIEPGSEQQTKQQIIDKINAIEVHQGDGITAFANALWGAWQILFDNAAAGNRQYVYVLSDAGTGSVYVAYTNYAPWSIPIFATDVYSFNTRTTLAEAARATRGSLKPNGFTHDQIMQLLAQDEYLGTRLFSQVQSNAPLLMDTDVAETESAVSFLASWGDGGSALFELVAPDGTPISPTNLPKGISYEASDSEGRYQVTAPAVGSWQQRVTPLVPGAHDEVELSVRSRSSLRMDLDVKGVGGYPEPWLIRARLSAGAPVLGAAVQATFSTAAGPVPDQIVLRDDGEAPDYRAGDGEYTAAVASVRDNGAYVLEVEATNTTGEARIASSEGSADAPLPVPLSAFSRRGSIGLDAWGFSPMPQSPDGALPIDTDFQPKWVAIDSPGDVVWLSFVATPKQRYVMMTGSLTTNDVVPMATRLSLYGPTGKDLIASDAREDGRAWIELDTPDSGGTYYLEVEHPAAGTGRLVVAVAPAEWFPNGLDGAGSTESRPEAAACGCRVGRTPTVPNAALLGLALGAWLARRWRRTAQRSSHCWQPAA